jgi:hypothetical protein
MPLPWTLSVVVSSSSVVLLDVLPGRPRSRISSLSDLGTAAPVVLVVRWGAGTPVPLLCGTPWAGLEPAPAIANVVPAVDFSGSVGESVHMTVRHTGLGCSMGCYMLWSWSLSTTSKLIEVTRGGP